MIHKTAQTLRKIKATLSPFFQTPPIQREGETKSWVQLKAEVRVFEEAKKALKELSILQKAVASPEYLLNQKLENLKTRLSSLQNSHPCRDALTHLLAAEKAGALNFKELHDNLFSFPIKGLARKKVS